MEITTFDGFLRYFGSIRTRTLHVVDCVPPHQLEWRPRPGAFSFGDLVRHLGATERYMFTENARGGPSLYPGHGAELADGWSEVRAFFARMHDESIAILRALPQERLCEQCVTPAGTSLPVWKWLRAMVEHEVHHRGQIYLMLNMIGVVTPPLYGLTSEEVKANSVPWTGSSHA